MFSVFKRPGSWTKLTIRVAGVRLAVYLKLNEEENDWKNSNIFQDMVLDMVLDLIISSYITILELGGAQGDGAPLHFSFELFHN